ncbi:MAG: Glycyl-tRNA synthetase [Ktedonobacterales bacterium]|jgi:glycyl-tRNA synthetase|nr:MAG: Glycyl-tRNA synthetase [Ktedonobacterales bacterium]
MNKRNSGETDRMQEIVSLSKRRGFMFPSSEIYGGLNAVFDYGPLGVELKNNVKRAWWDSMTRLRDDVVGLDASILMARRVWQASGHEAVFTDPLVDCTNCKGRFRADHVEEMSGDPNVCPACGMRGTLTAPRQFNLMFKTYMGPVEEEAGLVYLRPETAQGIYVNYENVQTSMRKKLPFGIAQIGKAFRNEISPGNFTYRMREFEQMEMQFFIPPEQEEQWFNYWRDQRMKWYSDFGMRPESLQFHPHGPEELAHYARAAVDVYFQFPFGWREIEGIHDRTDFDLRRHIEYSGKDLSYYDDAQQRHYVPYIIETSVGADRSTLAFLCDAYDEEEVKGEKRVVLRLSKKLAPVKVAVMPLSKKDELVALTHQVHDVVRPLGLTQYDDTGGNIGKRYRRQDEIGTPYCVTVDFDSLEDKQVTIRERDSMQQRRVPIAELRGLLAADLES